MEDSRFFFNEKLADIWLFFSPKKKKPRFFEELVPLFVYEKYAERAATVFPWNCSILRGILCDMYMCIRSLPDVVYELIQRDIGMNRYTENVSQKASRTSLSLMHDVFFL